jgi:hypothetical protein
MNSTSASEIFFIISSVGFVILWILAAIILFYIVRGIHAFSRILDKIEGNIDKIGDTTKEAIEDMRDSAVFNFIFRKRRKRIKKRESE